MSIKRTLANLVEKITGRKCCRCHYNVDGRCCHPDGNMFMRCWHGITRPGYMERVRIPAAGDLTPEEKHQLAKIVTSLQEASETARDGGLLDDAKAGEYDWLDDFCPFPESED